MSPADRRLADFQHAYRARELDLGADRWVGFVSNGAGPAVLLLHSAMEEGESLFPLFTAVSTAMRPIAPSLPDTVDTVDTALDAILALLDRFVIERAHVFGHELGGYLAQRLVRRAPTRVASLTLLNSAPPSRRHAIRLEEELEKTRLQPEFWLRWTLNQRLGRLAAPDYGKMPVEDRQFWRKYIQQGLQIPGMKFRVRNASRLQLDYHRGPEFSAQDLDSWPGQVNLIRFAKDEQFDDLDSKAMQSIYPKGHMTVMPDAGYLGLALKSPEVAEIIVSSML